jgi:GMP synthase-like glutamine amidotransferase
MARNRLPICYLNPGEVDHRGLPHATPRHRRTAPADRGRRAQRARPARRHAGPALARRRVQIPDGALRLAETPGFANQAFSYGPTVLALQFHLEADHTRLERWLIGHAHELTATRIDLTVLRDDARRHGPVLEAIGGQVLRSWLDQAV